MKGGDIDMHVRKRSTSLYVRDIFPNQCELGTLLCILGMEQLNYCLEKFCTVGDFIFKVSRSSLRFSLILKSLVFVYAVGSNTATRYKTTCQCNTASHRSCGLAARRACLQEE